MSSGVEDYELHAPDMMFPLPPPSYANSQVYGFGGGNYKGNDAPNGWKDLRNYEYPWQDNFCEERSDRAHSAGLCPSSWAHQGQDIRPPTSRAGIYPVQAAEKTSVKWIDLKYGGVGLVSEDKSRVFHYLHMSEIKVEVGQKIPQGAMIGYVSQVAKAPTSVHLHFELLNRKRGSNGVFINDNAGFGYVSPFFSLVRSYERLIGQSGIQLDAISVCTPQSTRCAPATGIYEKAALVTCSSDGSFETLAWCNGSACSSASNCATSNQPVDLSIPTPLDLSSAPDVCDNANLPRVTWTPKTPLAKPYLEFSSFAATKDRLHVFGPTSPTHRWYDLAADAWVSALHGLPSGTVFPLIATSFRDAVLLFIQASDAPGVYQEQPDGSWKRLLASTFWTTFSGLAVSSNIATYLLVPTTAGPGDLKLYSPLENFWGTLIPRSEGSGIGSVLYNGDLHVFGGDIVSSAVSRYNLGSSTWSKLSPLPQARSSFAAIVRGRLIWIAGGKTESKDGSGKSVYLPTDTILLYHPPTNEWCPTSLALPVATKNPVLYEISGKVYLLTETGALWEGVAN